MAVFCVHLVLEHLQQQLDMPEAAAGQSKTKASGTVRQDRWHGPFITYKIQGGRARTDFSLAWLEAA
jgi:hypothetical protein